MNTTYTSTHEKNLILILNASEGILQIIVGRKNKILVHQEWDCPQKSVEKLTPLLEDIFKKLDCQLNEIEYIACVVGAGSFTGIRLTIQTAAALARVYKIKQVAIDFLQALAFNAPIYPHSHIAVLTHAKKHLVHYAEFVVNEDNIPIQEKETSLIEPQVLLEELKEKNYKGYLVGSGTLKLKDILHKEMSEEINKDTFAHISFKVLPDYTHILNPQALLFLAHTAYISKVKDEDIYPDYVRNCDAVENLTYISEKLGNNANAAHGEYSKLIGGIWG